MKEEKTRKYGTELHPQDRTWLLIHTNWEWGTLDRIYKAFKDECPKGGIYRRFQIFVMGNLHYHTHVSQLDRFFPTGMASKTFLDHIFRYYINKRCDENRTWQMFASDRTLDADGSGYLDFKEFIMANKLVSASDPKDKLLWAFRV